MKTSFGYLFILILIASNFSISSPGITSTPNQDTQTSSDLEGSWAGTLKISNVELRIVFNVSLDSTGKFIANLDSPDQGAYGIAVDEVIIKDDSIKFIVGVVKGFYAGKIFPDSLKIAGIWNQGGMALPLDLKKTEKLEKPKRPQEPKEPFPYKSEDVKFINNKTGNTLAGTLTLPNKSGPFTVVILVTGSGPQNRNEELLGHKPFLVLADYLTRKGIAVLRYDDRGIGESTGDFTKATSEDFADDALAAVEYLKTRNEINKIGVAGHSEGGIIAPMVAVQSEDVNFIVLMAGTGIRGDSILMLQTELIMRATGSDEATIKRDLGIYRQIYSILVSDNDDEAIKQDLSAILDDSYKYLTEEEKAEVGTKEQMIEMQLNVLLGKWFRYFVKYDPYPTLVKVKCPVLAINGEKDLQVPPKENLSAIEKALIEGGNKNYKIVEMPGLNHLFQKSETGSPTEYGNIEETFSPEAMKVISDWILGEIKN
ncbi:MAG TPA: alpha/beta fold hydrolase [Ignavibacteriaceae bacterium]|nr:alpha/beta fold hydrolase [Ignavibacteriaceae bacterium]